MRDAVQKLIETCPFQPVDDSLIIYRIKLDQTAGGVLLPEQQAHKASRGFATAGVVIAVGSGRFIEQTGQRKPIDVVPGQKILFSSQAGLELGEVVRKELGKEFSFEEIRLLRAHDVIAIFKNIGE